MANITTAIKLNEAALASLQEIADQLHVSRHRVLHAALAAGMEALAVLPNSEIVSYLPVLTYGKGVSKKRKARS